MSCCTRWLRTGAVVADDHDEVQEVWGSVVTM
jgi:hypothetical protein